VDLTTDGVEVVPHQRVDVEALTEQLIPIRDALLALFQGRSGRSPVALQRLEIGLAVTPDGRVAFTTGKATPSLTLTFDRRARESVPTAKARAKRPAARAVAAPEVVQVD